MKAWLANYKWQLSIVMLAIAAALAGWMLWPTADEQPDVRSATIEQLPPPQLVSGQADLAFVGDIFLGRGVDDKARQTDNHVEYPFANLNELELDNYQAVIGNLECPSVNDEVDYQQQYSLLLFNCPTSYLPALAKHFDIVSLANNHTDNQQGQTGLDTTRQNLEAVGVNHFGNYEPGVLEDICKLIPIEFELSYDDGQLKKTEIAAQFCGYHTVFRHATEQEISAITAGSVLPTFVMPHAGSEYRAQPIPGKVAEFRQMIAAGADAIVGAHPHWVQTTEVYQDKLIAYSLGNFIFDQGPGETRLGALLAANLSIDDVDYIRALEEIARDCSSLSDCPQLEQLSKSELQLDYQVQAVDIVDYRPQLGSQASQTKLTSRMELPLVTTDEQD